MDNKRIFLKLERVAEDEVKLELNFTRDDECYSYIMGIASTPDENGAGFIVENKALLDAWVANEASGKKVAVYEKHSTPVGKVVACEDFNNKVLVVLEIPKAGNERMLAVYEQGIYVGLSIGGWTIDGEWIENTFHVTEFEWYEVSLTDIPSNENALLLEFANAKKAQAIQLEVKETEDSMKITLEQIAEQIRGIK